MNSPIVLFVYKRPLFTKLTIESLQNNAEAGQSDLIIYSDAARAGKDEDPINDVRNYIKDISGFKSIKVYESNQNIGLANSIIKGVTETIDVYGSAIVLEDDMIVSPCFLKYMNDAFYFYKNE